MLFAIVGLFFAIWGAVLILRAKKFEKLGKIFPSLELPPITFRILVYVVGGGLSLFGLIVFFRSIILHKPI